VVAGLTALIDDLLTVGITDKKGGGRNA